MGFDGARFMGTGILICGLNGTGKNTLGKAVAEKLNFFFIDSEELYFAKTDQDVYAFPRTHEEAKRLFLSKVKAHENFVFAAVKGDFGESFIPCFQYAVLIEVPKEIRLQRVQDRSFQKFGNRMLPGGDLQEQEKHFFEFVKSREEDAVEKWVQSLTCPIIRVDGTKPVEENTNLIIAQILEKYVLGGKGIFDKSGFK